jgi:hypothetical protein
MFIYYAKSVESQVESMQKVGLEMIPIAARIAKVHRVIQGHTHKETFTRIGNVDYFNTGTWSPAYHDLECKEPYGKKCFAWIHPEMDKPESRICELFEWTGGDFLKIKESKKLEKDEKISIKLEYSSKSNLENHTGSL